MDISLKSIMEDMLGQRMRPPIALKELLANYRKSLADFQPHPEFDLRNTITLDEGDRGRQQSAMERCSIKHLAHKDDAPVLQYIPGLTEHNRRTKTHIPKGALELKTFKRLLTSKETSERNPFKRSRDIFKTCKLPETVDAAEPCSFFEDLVVTVRVYRPARATHIGRTIEKPVFAEEFQCLGSNFLTDLRDRISCVCNRNHFYDISENPNADLPTKASDPGYFFITDTFYNDHRNAANPDYSATVREWAKRAAGLRNANFKVASMEETRFLDLTVSLGFPQLYQHHGNCEHVFTFSQVNVLTQNADCTQRSQYPYLRSFGVFNNRQCNMCGLMHYSFIVEQSDRQLHDPAYLCYKCFHSFHYIDGKKVGHFKAYRVNELTRLDDTDELPGECVQSEDSEAVDVPDAAAGNQNDNDPSQTT